MASYIESSNTWASTAVKSGTQTGVKSETTNGKIVKTILLCCAALACAFGVVSLRGAREPSGVNADSDHLALGIVSSAGATLDAEFAVGAQEVLDERRSPQKKAKGKRSGAKTDAAPKANAATEPVTGIFRRRVHLVLFWSFFPII